MRLPGARRGAAPLFPKKGIAPPHAQSVAELLPERPDGSFRLFTCPAERRGRRRARGCVARGGGGRPWQALASQAKCRARPSLGSLHGGWAERALLRLRRHLDDGCRAGRIGPSAARRGVCGCGQSPTHLGWQWTSVFLECDGGAAGARPLPITLPFSHPLLLLLLLRPAPCHALRVPPAASQRHRKKTSTLPPNTHTR